jgi:large subunit ribosomal protein L29
MTKVLEFREKTVEELTTLLATKQREMVEMKREHAAGELPNPRTLTSLRRDIARIKTVLGEMKAAVSTKENE